MYPSGPRSPGALMGGALFLPRWQSIFSEQEGGLPNCLWAEKRVLWSVMHAEVPGLRWQSGEGGAPGSERHTRQHIEKWPLKKIPVQNDVSHHHLSTQELGLESLQTQTQLGLCIKTQSRKQHRCDSRSRSFLELFYVREILLDLSLGKKASVQNTLCQCICWTAVTEEVGGYLAHTASGFWPMHDKEEEKVVVESPFHPRTQTEQFWLQG